MTRLIRRLTHRIHLLVARRGPAGPNERALARDREQAREWLGEMGFVLEQPEAQESTLPEREPEAPGREPAA